MKLSIVVPVYKAGNGLTKDITKKRLALNKFLKVNEYELIYVFDGSEQSNAEKLRAYLYRHNVKNVRVYTRITNVGKGYSVIEGFYHARGNYIGYIDYGNDIENSILSTMYKTIRKNVDLDMVAANKYDSKSNFKANIIRKICSFGYLAFVRLCSQVKAPDVQTGAKIYRRKAIKKILPTLLVKRFAFEVEILTALQANGFSNWAFLPVKIKHTDKSTTKLFDGFKNDIFKVMVDTLAIGYRKNFLNWYNIDTKTLAPQTNMSRILGKYYL